MSPVDAEADITFSPDDVRQFAAWSADRNPLHVDPVFARQTHFGQQVVHGVLTVLRSLRSVGRRRPRAPCGRSTSSSATPWWSGRPIASNRPHAGRDLAVALKSGEQLVLDIRAGFDAPAPAAVDLGWVASAGELVRTSPAVHSLDEFQAGLTATGRYAFEPAIPDSASAGADGDRPPACWPCAAT